MKVRCAYCGSARMLAVVPGWNSCYDCDKTTQTFGTHEVGAVEGSWMIYYKGACNQRLSPNDPPGGPQLEQFRRS